MNSLQLIMYIALGLLSFLFFMVYIYPRYFDRPRGGTVKQAIHRSAPILIDGKLPGVFAEIEQRTPYNNGMSRFKLHNKNGFFVRYYVTRNVVPLDAGQVICDTEAPVFVTLETMSENTQFKDHIDSLSERLRKAISDADHWKKEYNNIKANVNVQVESQVKQAMEMTKANRPDWNNANRT